MTVTSTTHQYDHQRSEHRAVASVNKSLRVFVLRTKRMDDHKSKNQASLALNCHDIISTVTLLTVSVYIYDEEHALKKCDLNRKMEAYQIFTKIIEDHEKSSLVFNARSHIRMLTVIATVTESIMPYLLGF